MLTCLGASAFCPTRATWLSAPAVSMATRESTSSIEADLKVYDGISIEIGSRNLPIDWSVESGSRIGFDPSTATCSETIRRKIFSRMPTRRRRTVNTLRLFRRLVSCWIPWRRVGANMASHFVSLQPVTQYHRVRTNIQPETHCRGSDFTIS